MQMTKLLETLLTSSEAASDIIDMLPDTDLVYELDQIVLMHWQLLIDIIEENELDTHDIDELLVKSREIIHSMKSIKNSWKN